MSEGYVALLEAFIDTAVVCTMTALVFVVAIPNLPGLYLLAPRIRQETLGYEARIRERLRADR